MLLELMGKPLDRAQRGPHDEAVTVVKQRLDPAEFAAAWTEGRSMSLEQALAYSLEERFRI